MTLLHQAAQKVAEALESYVLLDEQRDNLKDKFYVQARAAIAALQSALQQQPEPVAWMYEHDAVNDRQSDAGWEPYKIVSLHRNPKHPHIAEHTPLYTAPPALQQQEVPVSDAQIDAVAKEHFCNNGDGDRPSTWGPNTLNRMWMQDVGRPYARAILAAFAAGGQEVSREPVAWQWRRKGDPWTLDKTFNSEVRATTPDSEVRALYASPSTTRQQEVGNV